MISVSEISRLAIRLFKARRDRITAENEEESVKDQIKVIMGDDEELETELGTLTWRSTKDTEVVDWKAIAIELNAPRWLMDKHTSVKPGVRRFCVPKTWDKLEIK